MSANRDPRLATSQAQQQLAPPGVKGVITYALQPLRSNAGTELAACCLQSVAPMALSTPLLLDLLCLEAALLGNPQAQGLSLLRGTLVRCKRAGRYSWQQIVGVVPQEGGALWALVVGQEGRTSLIPSEFVSPHALNPDQAGLKAELDELAVRWPTMLSSRQQVAEVHWALEGGTALLNKILERKQLLRGSGKVPVSRAALAALITTLRMPDGPPSRLLFVPPAHTAAASASSEAGLPRLGVSAAVAAADQSALQAAAMPAPHLALWVATTGQQGSSPALPPGFDGQGAASGLDQQQQRQQACQAGDTGKGQQRQEDRSPVSGQLLPPGFGVRQAAMPGAASQQQQEQEAGPWELPPGFSLPTKLHLVQPPGVCAAKAHQDHACSAATSAKATPAPPTAYAAGVQAQPAAALIVDQAQASSTLPAVAPPSRSAPTSAGADSASAAAAAAAAELAGRAQALGALNTLDSAAAPELLLGIKRDLERLLAASGLQRPATGEAGGAGHWGAGGGGSGSGAAVFLEQQSGSGTDGVWLPPQMPAMPVAAQVETSLPAAPATMLGGMPPPLPPAERAPGQCCVQQQQGERQQERQQSAQQERQQSAQQRQREQQAEEQVGSEEGELLEQDELPGWNPSPSSPSFSTVAKKQRQEDEAPAAPEGSGSPAISQAAAGEGEARGRRRKRGRRGEGRCVILDDDSHGHSTSSSRDPYQSRSCSRRRRIRQSPTPSRSSSPRSRGRSRSGGRLPIDALPQPVQRAIVELCERSRGVLPLSGFNHRVVMRMQDLLGARTSLMLAFLEGLEAELPAEPLRSPAPWIISKTSMDRVRGQFAQLPGMRGGHPIRHLPPEVQSAVKSFCKSSYGKLPLSAFDLEVVGRMLDLGGAVEQLRFVQYLDDQLRPGVLQNPSAWVMNRLMTVLGYD